ncbi:hypothetical protein KGM_200300 [Danaus plexippus plexippus]|uniref:Uncharacterized protein n=1 Tax=Danaus plexippus plexippus TaxID=278856 RepID=A0A212EIR9_DANPL|nr:hypothetical protein KGM_200300 [Danaus plexippus plexippus]
MAVKKRHCIHNKNKWFPVDELPLMFQKLPRMPVRNCCLGCQGPMHGPCGPGSCRMDPCCCVGPCCVHSIGANCRSPCGDRGCIHGARGGVAGSFFSCGHGCIGGCTGGLCASCCGPACG